MNIQSWLHAGMGRTILVVVLLLGFTASSLLLAPPAQADQGSFTITFDISEKSANQTYFLFRFFWFGLQGILLIVCLAAGILFLAQGQPKKTALAFTGGIMIYAFFKVAPNLRHLFSGVYGDGALVTTIMLITIVIIMMVVINLTGLVSGSPFDPRR